MTKRKRHHRAGRYDPQPTRHRRGPRTGIEPAGLKRWRLSHRSHDPHPSPRRHFRRRRARYDPQPRRRRSFRSGASRVGRGIEGALNKWGTILGFGLGMGAGVYQGYTAYNTPANPNAGTNYLNTIIGGPIKNPSGTVQRTAIPEVSHLWNADPTQYTIPNYLQYKFLGIQPDGTNTGSAWVIPFWASLGVWIGSTIGMKIGKLGKLSRFLRPLSKIAKGATIGTVIGALTLPGCGTHGPAALPPPPPNNVVPMTQNRTGQFVPVSTPTVEYTYRG